ncbi:MAG: penicillin-binding protein 2 [Elusimicrobia bacterium]|nr:penicillin-binding protein 2 [Elusimicrobiota bacterium]
MWYRTAGWDRFRKSAGILGAVSILFLTVLLFRLFQVQIIKGYRFSEKSQGNYLKKFVISPKRGNIISSDGKIVATTYISYDLVARAEISYNAIEKISAISGIPVKRIRKNILKSKRRGDILLTLAQDLKGKPLIALASNLNKFPSLRILKVPRRFYPFEEVFSTCLGYLGPLDKESRGKPEYSYAGALHGRAGVEKKFDRFLFGRPGGEIIEVDASGRVIEIKGNVPPKLGDEIVLTLNSKLQKTAYEAFASRPGAAVGINPETGEILLLVSSPGFKASAFSSPGGKVTNIIDSQKLPLVNRAIQMKYPPGSTFKIVTSACFLNEKKVDVSEKFFCDGSFRYGSQCFKCWKKKGHGWVDFMKGFSQSCNVYFYNTALRLSGKLLSRYARMMGLDLNVFDDIGGELPSTIPDPQWKKKRYKMIWLPGDTINMAIGQGYLWVTPIQMALLVCGISQDGVIRKPFVVKEVFSPDGTVEYRARAKIVRKYNLNKEVSSLLKSAMRKTVTDGTGRIVNLPGAEIYGKTGTAQNPRGEDHGWFVSFGGGELSDFCLAVVVEHGGMGASSAGPIARKIWEKYIEIKNEEN